MSINATTERPGTLPGRLSIIPWLTVLPLAVVMAYADGFWIISLRGAAGAIERTGQPFATWLRESTLTLPIFVIAVLGALTLAARWFGPVLRNPKTVMAAALMVVAAARWSASLRWRPARRTTITCSQISCSSWARCARWPRWPRWARPRRYSRRRSSYRYAQWALAAEYSWSPTSCSSAGRWHFGAADWTSARPDTDRFVRYRKRGP
jgi:hypothetical protein